MTFALNQGACSFLANIPAFSPGLVELFDFTNFAQTFFHQQVSSVSRSFARSESLHLSFLPSRKAELECVV
jgi:hypothetical protein